MRKIKIILIIFALTISTINVFAGNTDRSGEAGAFHLLINPWARSSGLHGLNSAHAYGVEAMRTNVGGLATIDGNTQILLASSIWFQGAEIFVNSFGLAQKVGNDGVLGLSFMSFNVGQINVTTENDPEGTGAVFKPSFSNIGISYAKAFSNSIRGGATIRIVNESISDVKSTGVAIDAGILYTAGEFDNIRFGISLRNVGTPMTYSGNGLTIKGEIEGEGLSVEQKSAKFELPSLLNIGLAYDFLLNENKLTVIGNFTSNSFSRDILGVGAEFSFMEMFAVRAGFRYEDDMFAPLEPNGSTNNFNGLSAGFSFDYPIQEGGPNIGIDYAYRGTKIYKGVHTLAIKLDI